jgi:hypothetical protein
MTSWTFSFAGKISRAARRNKQTVTAAAQRSRFPCRRQAGYGSRRDWQIRSVESRREIEALTQHFHRQGPVAGTVDPKDYSTPPTLDIAKN